VIILTTDDEDDHILVLFCTDHCEYNLSYSLLQWTTDLCIGSSAFYYKCDDEHVNVSEQLYRPISILYNTVACYCSFSLRDICQQLSVVRQLSVPWSYLEN